MAEDDVTARPPRLTARARLGHFNKMLVFIMLYLACCALNYGYDVGTFSGVQAMQSFQREFGVYNPDTGLWALPGWLSSVMTATPFFGKAIGCIGAGWIAERWGRKMAILGLCITSVIGAVLQVTATTAAQFTVGRIICYGMTGMAIVVVPIYQAETSPRVLRGMFGSTIQVMIVFGQLIATLIAFGTQHIPDRKGWQIPIGLQLVVPAVITALLPLLPESPRWLLSRGRRADAVLELRKLRAGKSDEAIQLEIEAIAYAHANEERGTWREVFDASNRTRTGVAILAMLGQQITGQAFPSQYGVLFYQSQGFRSQAFLFNVISNIVSITAVAITWFYVDAVGRRPVLLLGGSLMGAWLYVMGGIGTMPKDSLNVHERNLIVTSLMMFSFFYNLSWAPVSFVIVSEAAALRVKEKTNLLACVISVLTTFVTSFTVPYLINEQYANLGGKVGFIYGSTNFLMVALTWLFIPELKGRTLEEVDQLFASGAPLRHFGRLTTRTAEEVYRVEVARGKGDHAVGTEAAGEGSRSV